MVIIGDLANIGTINSTNTVSLITGNFDIIKDKRIRALLSKGPKYRLPSLIDFDTCRNHISKP